MTKVIATIEARMQSSRLPGKVLLPLNRVPALEQMIRRVRSSKSISDIVVATTDSPSDDEIVNLCNRINCNVYRGSESDVLGRVLEAALHYKATHIVELTGDCPLVDPAHIDDTVQFYFKGNYEYVYNRLQKGFPDGFDVQIFSVDSLKRVSELTSDPIDRVHVSCYFYKNPQKFKLGSNSPSQSSIQFWPEIALTMDEKSDYVLIDKIFSALSPQNDKIFNCTEILSLLKAHPELLQINEKVERKKLEDG